MQADIIIVGTGVSGLFSALNLPSDKQIIMLTKADIEESDSFLAQGGICVLRDENDYDSYFEDTMRAGHYENNPQSVDIMLRSSRDIINDLIRFGVDFAKQDGNLIYTREGAHSSPRILYHEDITGKEITSKLIKQVQERQNIKIVDHFTMLDIVEENGECIGIVGKDKTGALKSITADYTILATGGISYPATGSTGDGYTFAEDLAAVSLSRGSTKVTPRSSSASMSRSRSVVSAFM